ncbi:MAG: hypothetical protein WCA20_21200 [Candidatus Sulfotelmatobacter sp.]
MKQEVSLVSARQRPGIDQMAGPQGSGSAFIERVLRRYSREQVRAQTHARDLERINHAGAAEPEAAEVLDYQAAEE